MEVAEKSHVNSKENVFLKDFIVCVPSDFR